MRVLSLHQPFAQLVVRGVKRVEVRSWTTQHRGRIAIHAKGVPPSQEIESRWRANRDLALRLADEGWLDREDLKKLPRSAIIGTVNLTGIARGRDQQKDAEDASGLFAWNPVTKWFELAARDRRTGELRPRYSPMRPLPVTFKPNDYLWAFGDAVEIEPVEDVPGKQNLWHLGDTLSAQVERREAQSLSGEWERPPVNRKRRDESIRVWRGRYLSDLEREVIRVEETVLHYREMQTLAFARPFEFKFERVFMEYVEEQGTQEVDGVQYVGLDRRLRTLFQGREWMPVRELERDVRRYFKTELARQAAAERQQRHRKLMMQRLLEIREAPAVLNVDGEVVTAEIQLEHMLHKMMDEEEGVSHKRPPEPKPRRRTPVAGTAAPGRPAPGADTDDEDSIGRLYELLEMLGIDDSEVFYNSRPLIRPPGRRKQTADPEDDA
jgi:hypothetical protein